LAAFVVEVSMAENGDGAVAPASARASLVREVVLDTETTGMVPEEGHRLVEIGAIELLNHVPTGRVFHTYVNPERDMPADALLVHGLTSAFLRDQPVFAEVADALLAFLDSDGDGNVSAAKLVIHNSAFDLAFLNSELRRAGRTCFGTERLVVDTLALARQRFPNTSNSLDALCRRFEVDATARTRHGALLDAELLAEVYLGLLGGRQPDLGLIQVSARQGAVFAIVRTPRAPRPHAPTAEELAAHEAFLGLLGSPIWQL
jgi:DNA polymerase-3 subunit epsilon